MANIHFRQYSYCIFVRRGINNNEYDHFDMLSFHSHFLYLIFIFRSDLSMIISRNYAALPKASCLVSYISRASVSIISTMHLLTSKRSWLILVICHKNPVIIVPYWTICLHKLLQGLRKVKKMFRQKCNYSPKQIYECIDHVKDTYQIEGIQ